MTILTFSTEELHLETPEIEGNIPSDFWSLTKLGKVLDMVIFSSLFEILHRNESTHIVDREIGAIA